MSSISFPKSVNSTLDASTMATSEIVDDFDYDGAIIYIGFILIWYSMGIVLMLLLQVRPNKFHCEILSEYHTTVKSIASPTNPFDNYHNVEADHAKRHILNELNDPERRARLWKIYYSSKGKQDEPPPQCYGTMTVDSARINHADRKLASIHQINEGHQDSLVRSSLDFSSNNNQLDGKKSLIRRITSLHGMSSTPINNREPLIPIQSSPDTQVAILHTDVKSTICAQQSNVSSANDSHERIDAFSSRFTEEKISDNTGNDSAVIENLSRSND